MKLELKHLVGYLPYGLNGLDGRYACELIGVLNDDPFLIGELRVEYNQDNIGYDFATIKLCSFKPILRPLSDLTKEIDGVVHAVELGKLDINIQKHNRLLVDSNSQPIIDYKIITKPFGKVLKVTNCDRWLVYLSLTEPFRCHHYIIEYLFQHHFDVYGLIEKGLAIDINKIENV